MTSTAATGALSGRKTIVAGLMLSMFLVALDGTVVSTAMPSIVGNLGGFSLYAWVPSVYLLTTAVSTPLYGKIADLTGRKRILFVGIGLFLLGSAASGASQSMLMLIIFRALQGLGAGAVMPVTTTIIADIFSLEQRARMQGLFSSVWGISSVIGPLLGGALVDGIGWRWIFYLNIPFGLLAIALISSAFREQPVTRQHALDTLGAGYLATALTALLLVLIEGGQAWAWLSWQSALLASLAIVTFAAFIVQERRAVEPVIPLSLFSSRIIVVPAIGTFFAGIVIIGVTFEVPLFVQGLLGGDALKAGLALTPMSIGWPLAGAISGRLAIRFGYRATATAGMILNVVGAGLFLSLSPGSSLWQPAVFSFVVGVGMGLSTTPMLIAVQSAVPWARRGLATATNMFVRSFGQVVGLAVMGAIINAATGSLAGSVTSQSLEIQRRHDIPAATLVHIHTALFHGIHQAFLSGFAAAIVGVLVVAALPGGSAREHVVDEGDTAVRTSESEAPAQAVAPRVS